ncbi:hypothetical protein ABZ234_07825 [Nocardiopsis sp. NPDC006198]|uniref:hypothetical protein n=1 Tax=Nocardiopsis sp. NPDC006198 TaxID=3154472 RepID=UPI0033A1C3E0
MKLTMPKLAWGLDKKNRAEPPTEQAPAPAPAPAPAEPETAPAPAPEDAHPAPAPDAEPESAPPAPGTEPPEADAAPAAEPGPEAEPEVQAPQAPAPAPAAVPAGGPRTLAAPPSAGPDPVRLIAGLITIASAITTVWALWDQVAGVNAALPLHVVGLAAGLVVEGGWLLVLASNYQQAAREGHVAPWRTAAGWVLALAAAALLLFHGVDAGQMAWTVLGLLPMISKTAWAVLTHSRAQQTLAALAAQAEQETAAAAEAAADDTSLSVERRREIAELWQDTNYIELKSEAEVGKAEAEINARTRVQVAQERGNFTVMSERLEMAGQLVGTMPLQVLAMLMQNSPPNVSATQVPTWALGAAPAQPGGGGMGIAANTPAAPVAGFGAGLFEAQSAGGGNGGNGGGIGGTAPDQAQRPAPAPQGGGTGGIGGTAPDQAQRPAPAPQGGGTAPEREERAPHHAARIAEGERNRQRVLEVIQELGVDVTNAELERRLPMSRTTVRDHRNALHKSGHTVFGENRQP